VCAYAIGLMLAFLANVFEWTINGVQGQPALMYIVPATLSCFIGLAAARGDLRAIWSSAWLDWELPREETSEQSQADDLEDTGRAPSL
jgi:hypothetical protein